MGAGSSSKKVLKKVSLLSLEPHVIGAKARPGETDPPASGGERICPGIGGHAARQPASSAQREPRKGAAGINAFMCEVGGDRGWY